MNIGSRRATRYEVTRVSVGANQLHVECAERDVGGSSSREELHESLFTPDELEQVHAFLTLIETKYEAIRQEKEAALGINRSEVVARDQVHRLLRQAEAAKVEAAKAATEIFERRAQVAELDTKLSRAEDEVAAKRAELDEIERALAQKRGELEATDDEKDAASSRK